MRFIPVDGDPFAPKQDANSTPQTKPTGGGMRLAPVEGNPFEMSAPPIGETGIGGGLRLTPVDGNPFEEAQKKREIQEYEAAGGGIGTSLERGGRRLKQTLAGAGAALGDFIAPETPTGPIGQFLRDQAERDKAEVMQQQEAIQALPSHPTMQRAVTAANEAEGYLGAIGEFGKEVAASPDTLGFVVDQAAELVPQVATFLLGTKGVDKIIPLAMQGVPRLAAQLGGGGFVSSVANTYGPNVAEAMQQGMEFDQAQGRAALQSAVQGGVDALTSAVIPWKIGPNQITNIPAQTLIQMLGGAAGEIARKKVVGEEAEKGEVAAEALLEALGLPGEAVTAMYAKATQKTDKKQKPPPKQAEEAKQQEGIGALPLLKPDRMISMPDGSVIRESELAAYRQEQKDLGLAPDVARAQARREEREAPGKRQRQAERDIQVTEDQLETEEIEIRDVETPPTKGIEVAPAEEQGLVEEIEIGGVETPPTKGITAKEKRAEEITLRGIEQDETKREGVPAAEPTTVEPGAKAARKAGAEPERAVIKTKARSEKGADRLITAKNLTGYKPVEVEGKWELHPEEQLDAEQIKTPSAPDGRVQQPEVTPKDEVLPAREGGEGIPRGRQEEIRKEEVKANEEALQEKGPAQEPAPQGAVPAVSEKPATQEAAPVQADKEGIASEAAKAGEVVPKEAVDERAIRKYAKKHKDYADFKRVISARFHVRAKELTGPEGLATRIWDEERGKKPEAAATVPTEEKPPAPAGDVLLEHHEVVSHLAKTGLSNAKQKAALGALKKKDLEQRQKGAVGPFGFTKKAVDEVVGELQSKAGEKAAFRKHLVEAETLAKNTEDQAMSTALANLRVLRSELKSTLAKKTEQSTSAQKRNISFYAQGIRSKIGRAEKALIAAADAKPAVTKTAQKPSEKPEPTEKKAASEETGETAGVEVQKPAKKPEKKPEVPRETLTFDKAVDLAAKRGVPEEDIFELADFLPKGKDQYSRSEVSIAIRQLRSKGRAATNKKAKEAALASNEGKALGLELKHKERDQWAVILPDATEAGKFRSQRYDENGFYSHSTVQTADAALDELVADGFSVPDKGAMDRLSKEDAWKTGMEQVALVQKANEESFARSQKRGKRQKKAMPLNEIFFMEKVKVIGTGKEETIRMKADEMLAEVDGRLEDLYQLKECVS